MEDFLTDSSGNFVEFRQIPAKNQTEAHAHASCDKLRSGCIKNSSHATAHFSSGENCARNSATGAEEIHYTLRHGKDFYRRTRGLTRKFV